jgi:glycolate oxidase iron-sulfur subunit
MAGWDPDRPAPDAEDIVKCVSCGLCLPHCPTFRLTGRETASPRGRIAAMRAVEERGAPLDGAFATMMDECLACRACETACPSGVPFGRMIEAARTQVEPTRPAAVRGLRRLALAAVLPRQGLVRALGVGLAVTQALRLDRVLPSRLIAGAPRVGIAAPFRRVPRWLGRGPEAILMTGCIMDVAFRDVHAASMRAIAASGYRAVRPARAGCCGALAAHYGHPEAARELARRRIAELEGFERVVVDSAGCSAHMKHYGDLLADDPEWAERARSLARRTVDVLELEPEVEPAELGPVAMHDACHHLNGQLIADQPRRTLQAAGATLCELGDGGRCCGAAGAYSLAQPELSARLRRQKADAIIATGAPIVAVANPGCAIQIARGLRERGSRVWVAHPAELTTDL